ncbi:MAG: type II secretion system F family protein [Mariprofundus sp.]
MDFLSLYLGEYDELLVQLLVFLATAAFCLGFAVWLYGGKTNVQRRLEYIIHPEIMPEEGLQREGGFTVRLAQSAAAFIAPEAGWDESGSKTRLVRAGYRSRTAVRTFWGNKIIFALLVPAIIVVALVIPGFDVGGNGYLMLIIALSMLFGFYLPDLFLRRRINGRRLRLTEGFPDAMDLFVVCVEAGLGLDAAIQRVGVEIAHSHRELGEEFSILSLELRAGKSREEALHALANRVDIDEIHELAALLIQAEHFGTSIADALRIHASDMRTLRIQRARERAAKLSTKLIIPIMLFIFPALFLVILGPAVVGIVDMLSALTGGR